MAVTTPAIGKWANVATVTFVVGETKTAFHVHETDLFKASSFFKAAFTSKFRESSERTMTLPEDDEGIFDLFVDWLYYGRYDIPSSLEEGGEDCDIPSSLEEDEEDYDDRFLQPVQLFVLADKYDVRTLKNHIIDQLFHAFDPHEDVPSLTTIVYAFEHTFQGSPIRKFLADVLTHNYSLEWLQSANNQTWLRNHPDIAVDVIASFANYRLTEKNPFKGEIPVDYVEQEQRSSGW